MHRSNLQQVILITLSTTIPPHLGQDFRESNTQSDQSLEAHNRTFKRLPMLIHVDIPFFK